ncbi:FecR family protein [Pseudoflavitalea sp. X16]|uniref:FecR family protein n=1 Tax=Paraflavitalea devenefica TaxID=2716334 RepID=UPI001424564A|nr:FecR family protein [Paraflavitalea devenefica]NII27854.1 FecR family protein [Paraflavitalea devenefica]
MSRQDLLQELFEKFLHDKKMTPAEIRQLQALVQDERNRALLDQLLASFYEEEVQEPGMGESNSQAAFEEVWAKLQTPAPATIAEPGVVYGQFRRRWWRYAAAAVVVLTIGAGSWWLFRGDKTIPVVVQQNQSTQPAIQPGGNKAILTLADGSTIVLDSAANGTLVQQGSMQVVKSKEGELEYRKSEAGPEGLLRRSLKSEVGFNTLATPRGGRYTLTLPDGSKVWLNAASSIRYPTAFTGQERKVEITGEAYFEVEKNAKMPFHVLLNGMQVEVLGTHFNIHAYGDEAMMKTTLLEGSVKVKTGSQKSDLRPQTSAFLKPGQQAQIINHQLSIINDVDVEAAIAWKNGLIQFEGQDIHAAMRMLARWYDVAVEYRGNVPNAHFRGTIPSNVPVSQVLDMMEKTEEVHFEISGRKIIVTP